MKLYMRPIKMIAWFTENGLPTPIRFQMDTQEENNLTISVDKVVTRGEEKLAGNKMLYFRCQSTLNHVLTLFELKYELATCKWYLAKM